MRLAPCLAVLLAGLTRLAPAAAQPSPSAPTLRWSTGELNPTRALVGLDDDDDDDDGVPDSQQSPAPPADDDRVALSLEGIPTGAVAVTVTGGLRVRDPSGGLVERANLPVRRGAATVELVGVAASARPDDASVELVAGAQRWRVAVTVAAVTVLHGDNAPVYAHRDAVMISRQVTNDETLPRRAAWGERSPDLENVRAEVWDPTPGAEASVRWESSGTPASFVSDPTALRARLAEVAMARPDAATPWRSGYVRLVGDEVDQRAPGVEAQTLRVALRDRVRVRYRRAGVAGEATTDVRVGRPGREDGPMAARMVRARVLVLRDRAQSSGGVPLVGGSEAAALDIGRRQVAIANEVYGQCGVTWGDPSGDVARVVDPPPTTMIAFGDDHGALASGGEVRLRVNGVAMPPLVTRAGWRPIDTAMAMGAMLQARGYRARVTTNPRTTYGARPSADVLVLDRAGRWTNLSTVPGSALSTDLRQGAELAVVDFSDGVDEFNNQNSTSGTLEERALIKPLIDDDVTTMEMIVINRFSRGTRIGEAFVRGDGGSIGNGFLIDRAGIAAEREAWTQSHEAGHILLDQPWHPDNMGPDRPWLLMDADASLGTVAGPKRISTEECARIRSRNGPDAPSPLMQRYDLGAASPDAARYTAWPAQPRYPRPSPSPEAAGAAAVTATPAVTDAPASQYGVRWGG
ncbi:MAG: hypothetical protein IPF99_04485 [Deltaproteobacteria bacterium]|nr:hypothetical protein [Deltaproteobacteria bacterium]